MSFLVPECGGGEGGETAQKQRGKPERAPVMAVSTIGWKGAESAGLAMAEKRGYFADEGVRVGALSPETPSRPVRYVVDGTDQLAISHMPQVVMAKAEGAPIVAVGSLAPKPTTALIWLKRSKIQGIADLKGKTIVIPGLSFQEKLLEHFLARGGLTLEDVTVRRGVDDLVTTLVTGRADAIFGGTWTEEGTELKARGLNPVIIRTGSVGIPPYEELVFIARTDFAAKYPQAIRGFLAAVQRGIAAVAEDPEAAAKYMVISFENDPYANPREMETQIRATLPLFSKTARMSPAQAEHLVDWMHQEGMIQTEPSASELLTNRYLP